MSTKDSPASCRERRITVGEIISAADEHQQVAVPTPWRCRARTADGGRARGESCRRLGYRGRPGHIVAMPYLRLRARHRTAGQLCSAGRRH
jgi:hypothetical protein